MAVIVETTYSTPVLYRNASSYRIDSRGDLHVVNSKGRIGSIAAGRWIRADVAQNRDARGRFIKQEKASKHRAQAAAQEHENRARGLAVTVR